MFTTPDKSHQKTKTVTSLDDFDKTEDCKENSVAQF